MNGPQARLFTALWPDPDTRRALATWQARWRWPPGARPTPPDQLHVTLHFLGAVPVERIADLGHALAARHAHPIAPFDLLLDQPALWAHGLAVLCPASPQPALADLHAAQGALLHRLGLPVDRRPYRPHVTLARKAAGAAPPDDTPALCWQVRGVALVASASGYHVLGRYGLG